MTREEAIKRLSPYVDNECYTAEHQEACRMAISALREQEEYEILKNSYAQLQDIFDGTYASNMAMGEALRKRQWISVEDALPDDSFLEKEIIVCILNRFGERNVYTKKFWGVKSALWNNDITHWMPLPSTEGLE